MQAAPTFSTQEGKAVISVHIQLAFEVCRWNRTVLEQIPFAFVGYPFSCFILPIRKSCGSTSSEMKKAVQCSGQCFIRTLRAQVQLWKTPVQITTEPLLCKIKGTNTRIYSCTDFYRLSPLSVDHLQAVHEGPLTLRRNSLEYLAEGLCVGLLASR